MKIYFALLLFSVGFVSTTENGFKSDRLMLNSDFEGGFMSPWYDESPANVKWAIEDYTSPNEVDQPAPKPINGTKYLRAIRNAQLDSGLAVLLTETTLMASPGDRISFSFWIRSRRTQGNNLELAMTAGRNETILASLSQFSTSLNYEWRTTSAVIPILTPTEISLAFYGYCGLEIEDAIAIDNIVIQPISLSTSTSIPEVTTTELTTSTEATTTEITTQTTTLETTTIPSTTPSTTTVFTCEYSFSAISGTFSSPNFPRNYDNSLSCSYVIDLRAHPRMQIMINFTAFNTESFYDPVTVYDSLDQSLGTLIFRDSGDNIPAPVTTNGNVALVTFTTNAVNTFPGWSLNYEGFIP